MNRSLTLSATVAATGLLVVAAGAPAAKPPKPPGGGPNTVTLTAKPNPISFGSFVTLSGRLNAKTSGGATVTLQADPYPFSDTGFFTKGTKTTGKNGSYSIAQAPGLNTRYRVISGTAPIIISPTVTVSVAYRVGLRISDSTPRRGASVRFSGSVGPRKGGSLAFIQKQRRDGSFVTVARARLTTGTATRSVYAKRLRVSTSGTYRVRVSGNAAHLAGYSRARTVTVH